MTTHRELKALSGDEIVRSRLVVLQAKRLMLGCAERRYRGTASNRHFRRVQQLRVEVERAQERYASTPPARGRMRAPMQCVRLIQRGNRALDTLRRLQLRLPAERRWEAATDIELLEEQMRRWRNAFGL